MTGNPSTISAKPEEQQDGISQSVTALDLSVESGGTPDPVGVSEDGGEGGSESGLGFSRASAHAAGRLWLSAVEKIAASPQRFPQTYAGCRRCLLSRYPYSVVFYSDQYRVVIVAVAHGKRRPGYWRERL